MKKKMIIVFSIIALMCLLGLANKSAFGKYVFNDEIIIGAIKINQEAAVIVKYIDEETGSSIATQEIIDGYIGKEYNSSKKDILGYEFVSSQNASGTMEEESKIATYYYKKINYTITYKLGGGTISGQKTTYTVETEDFTLPEPKKTGYVFTGWVGTGLSTRTKVVTIKKGSTGNRTYTANWTKEGVYGRLYDTNNDGTGETLVLNNIFNFTYTGNLITNFNNVDINAYQESKEHDGEIGAYQTPWNGYLEQDTARQQYKNITKVVINNTIKPTNMSMWFWKMPIKEIEGLEKINTSNCTNMYATFQFASNATITTLNLSTWNTSKVTNMMNMFYNCTSLVGENGTKYNATKIGKEYARIDKAGSPGYFTAK